MIPPNLTVLFWNVNLPKPNLPHALAVTEHLLQYAVEFQVNLIILAEATHEYAFELLKALNRQNLPGHWGLLPMAKSGVRRISRAGVVLYHSSIGTDAPLAPHFGGAFARSDNDWDNYYLTVLGTRESGYANPRGRMFYLAAHKLLVAGVHFVSKREADEKLQYEEVLKMSEIIRSRAKKLGAACIIVGDFNMHPLEVGLIRAFRPTPIQQNNCYTKVTVKRLK